MTYKVIQWTTGFVGREAVKGILSHPQTGAGRRLCVES